MADSTHRSGSIVAPLPDAVVKKHGVKTIESNAAVTGAQNITLRQSLLPVGLVTILFFLWGFAYGLLDVLNAHFQVALDISKGESGGLQAAYFGAYAIGKAVPNHLHLAMAVEALQKTEALTRVQALLHTLDGLFAGLGIGGPSSPASVSTELVSIFSPTYS